MSPIKVRLKDWYLRQIPFPAVPFVDPLNEDPLCNGTVFAAELRTSEIEHIRRDILRGGFDDLPTRWSWVWALRMRGRSLGMGKTALLTYLTDQINQDYGKKFFGHAAHWLAVYVPVKPKMKSSAHVAAAALVSMCSEARGVSVERLLLARIRHRVITLGLLGPDAALLHTASPAQFVKDRWLSDHGVDLEGLATAVERHLTEQQVSSALAHDLARGNLKSYLARINGDPFLIPPKAGFTAAALSLLLNEMALVVRTAGIKRMSLLVDDFFHLVSKTPDQDKISLATDLRAATVDGPYVAVTSNLYNWVVVMHKSFASTFNPAWEYCRMNQVAPLNPDNPSSVVLRAIPLDRGATLLEQYLEYRRPSGAPTSIHPFSDEGLATLTRIAAEPTGEGKYDPGTLLNHALLVISAALKHEPNPAPIGTSFVEHALRGTPLPELPETDEDEIPDTERSFGQTLICPCSCHSGDAEAAYDVMARIAGDSGLERKRYCGNCKDPIVLPA